ncbi:MAG: pilus assembly protein CpaE, partial [Planctomycetaceae bacterium]
LLRATFTHLVIDVSKSFSLLDLSAMHAADHVLMVTQLDLPCLRNAVRLLEFLETQDDLSDKIRVVVNRLGLEDAQISLKKALDTIGREIYAEIPNDYATMVESRNNGVPLVNQAPKAKLTRSLAELAVGLQAAQLDTAVDTQKKTKKGLFGFLNSGSQ